MCCYYNGAFECVAYSIDKNTKLDIDNDLLFKNNNGIQKLSLSLLSPLYY